MTKQLRRLLLEEYVADPGPDASQDETEKARQDELIERAIERLLEGYDRRRDDW